MAKDIEKMKKELEEVKETLNALFEDYHPYKNKIISIYLRRRQNLYTNINQYNQRKWGK